MDRSLRRHLELRLATHLRGPVRQFTDQTEIRIEAGSVVEVLQTLHDDPGLRFEILADLAGVDTGKVMQVVYHLWSERSPDWLRVIVDGLSRDDPRAPSATFLWIGAEWLEREAYDISHHLRGQPRPAPHPDAGRLYELPTPQGLLPARRRGPLSRSRHAARRASSRAGHRRDDPTAGVRRAPVS